MSRTTLGVLTAAVLTALALGTMAARRRVMGDEVGRPAGHGAWKVTLAVQGTALVDARVLTATPLDLDRQHVVEDRYTSAQLTSRPPVARHPERRQVLWSVRGGKAAGPIQLRCEFHVALDASRPHGWTARPPVGPYGPPRAGEYLAAESLIEANHERISTEARALTAELDSSSSKLDVAQALFRFVDHDVPNDPGLDSAPGGAVACLAAGRGDRAAKCRLLTALLRNRNIPARLVTGVTLSKGPEQHAHTWVEAWVYDHWISLCPFYHYFGRVPSSYLVFAIGDYPLVRGRHVKDLAYAFLVERVAAADAAPVNRTFGQRAFSFFSLHHLTPAERRLVEVLLLLPVAALIVCVFRNLIGLNSFGTFAPALIGLAFHEDALHSLPGILIFVSILLVGWVLRRVLDYYHLLQVPRVATMLTLIMVVLISVVVLSNLYGAATTRYVSLFPMVILTGMVERFWTLETEDSALASFRTLLQTMLIAAVIAVVLGWPALGRLLFCYPEALGLVMACQLLIGRYTGYRLMELFRFRDFLRPEGMGDRHWAIGGR